MSQFRSAMPELNAPNSANIPALIAMSERLATLLDTESVLLKAMKLKDIGILQQEKIALSHSIGMHQHLLHSNPELLDAVDQQTLDRLVDITEALQDIIAENMRLNTIARNVNQRVVNVISDAVRDRQRPATYTRYGTAPKTNNITVSLNLNQQA